MDWIIHGGLQESPKSQILRHVVPEAHAKSLRAFGMFEGLHGFYFFKRLNVGLECGSGVVQHLEPHQFHKDRHRCDRLGGNFGKNRGKKVLAMVLP